MASADGGGTGTSLGGRIEMSKRRKAAAQRARRREEARWAALAGPVTVRRIEDETPSEDGADE